MIDKSNYIKVLEDFPKQCEEALKLSKDILIKEKIDSIVVCGMGGSAIGGDILKSYLSNTNFVVEVVRCYKIPEWVNEKTLVFAISYSGNTEETLSCFEEAIKKKAQLIAITSNGKLAEKADNIIKIPSGMQPRAAVGYLFLPMIKVLHNSGIINVKDEEIKEMLSTIKKIENFKQKGKKLAAAMKDKIPVIYSSTLLEPAAYRFKTEINENAKSPAFYHVFPEMNHNELVGYKGMDNKFIAIVIRDKHDNKRIIKRMDIFKSIIKNNVPLVEIHTEGNYLLTRIFSAVYLGDFASYYLALEKKEDPAPVDVITYLKKELTK